MHNLLHAIVSDPDLLNGSGVTPEQKTASQTPWINLRTTAGQSTWTRRRLRTCKPLCELWVRLHCHYRGGYCQSPIGDSPRRHLMTKQEYQTKLHQFASAAVSVATVQDIGSCDLVFSPSSKVSIAWFASTQANRAIQKSHPSADRCMSDMQWFLHTGWCKPISLGRRWQSSGLHYRWCRGVRAGK